MWKSKCRTFRNDIALLAGNDLGDQARVEAERHLATCPECRELWLSLSNSQQVLEQVRNSEPVETKPEPSIWGDVQRRIRVLDERSTRRDWRGWLPAIALAAACLVVTLITSDLLDEQRADTPFARQPVPTQGLPVVNPAAGGSAARPNLVPSRPIDSFDAPGAQSRPSTDRNAPDSQSDRARNRPLNQGAFRSL